MKSGFTRKKIAYVIIRYVLIAAVAAAIVFFLAGKSESKASFDTVSDAVRQAADTSHMQESTARFLKKYFHLNAEEFDNVLIYTPITNMDACELLLIRLKDEEQADTVTEAVQARMEAQLEIYEGYAPEQVALLEAGIVDRQGSYLLYIVGDNAETVDESFRNALNEGR